MTFDEDEERKNIQARRRERKKHKTKRNVKRGQLFCLVKRERLQIKILQENH